MQKLLVNNKNNYFFIFNFSGFRALIFVLLTLFWLMQSGFAQAPPKAGVPSGYQGSTAVGSYPLSGLDNINYFNGNLDFNLPLMTIGGRGEASFTMLLTIGKPDWSIDVQSTLQTCDPAHCIYRYYYNPTTYNPNVLKAGLGPGVMRATHTGRYDDNNCQGAGGQPAYAQRLTTLTFAMPGGSAVELRDAAYEGKPLPGSRCAYGVNGPSRGNIFKSFDGSGMTFVSDTALEDKFIASFTYVSGYLYMKNGVRYRFDGGKVSRITDRNGNWIGFTYSQFGYVATDSLGRQISVETSNEAQPVTTITMLRSGNSSRTIKIYNNGESNMLRSDYQPLTFSQAFPELDGKMQFSGTMGVSGISKVELPDGRTYKFKYDPYSELARVELPTGGAFEYNWTGSAFAGSTSFDTTYNYPQYYYGNIIRGVAERRVYENGETGGNYTTKTTIAGLANGSDSAKTVKEYVAGVQNAISRTDHFFYGTPNQSIGSWQPFYTEGWKTGEEYQTDIYEGDGTQLLRKVQQTYQQRASVSWYCQWNQYCSSNQNDQPTNDPRLVETVTTLADSNQVSKTSAINPTTGVVGFDQHNNQTDVYEFDYGSGQAGAFKRRTHTDFISDSNYIDYTGAYLRSLPSQTWVSSDSNGITKASLTQFEYDNYAGGNNAALVSRTNVVGHDTANYGTNKTIRGNVTKVTTYGNAQTQTEAVSVYSNYDILGNVVKTFDAKGYISTIDYTDRFGSPDNESRSNTAPSYLDSQNITIYPLNGQSTFAFPRSVTNPIGYTAYRQFDYFTGQAVNTEDINGVVSKMIYNDALDRPTQSVTAVGTTFERQSNIIYDDANHRVETKSDLNALNDNMIKAESFYDGLGRTIEMRRYESDGGYVATKSIPFAVVQDTETQIQRVAAQVSNPYRPLAGEQPIWTTSLIDALGRPIKVITPDGAFVKTEYSGNATMVTDQAQKKRRSVTNAIGQLVRVDEPNESGQLDVSGTPAQPSNYSYDALNNLLQVQQIGTTTQQCGGLTSNCSQTRTFVYDSLSRLKQATNPESGIIQYQYDNNGNLSSKTDARNITTTYTYDSLNRVTLRDYSDSTNDVTYTYDNLTNTKGKLIKVDNGFSKTEYTQFDLLGRVTKSKQTTDGTGYNEMLYSYNLSGALIEETYPSGRVVKNTLDNDGDLAQVQSRKANDTFRNYANSFNYTAAGAVSSMRLGNGLWENTIFNSRLQPTQIGLGSGATSQNVLKLNYDYGSTANNGNVQSQTITVQRSNQSPLVLNQSYVYDSLNRLKSAEEKDSSNATTWKQTYDFDRYDNRRFDQSNTTFPTSFANTNLTNPTIDTANNRFTTGQGYTYDLSGNLITDAEGRSFSYDAENKQKDAQNSSNQTIGEYWYDGDGKRVKKKGLHNGQLEETIFVYDAGGKLVAEYSTQPSTTPQTQFLTNDNLGTPRINTDALGTVVSRSDYMPYGEEIVGLGGRSSTDKYVTDDVRQGFTGYIKDDETGLDFAQARMYANKLGRFTSADRLIFGSIFEPQSWNKYTYCLSNPLLYVDESGKFPTKIHELIIKLSFPGLTRSEIEAIQIGNNRVDRDGASLRTFDPRNAPEHANTSKYFPTKESAERKMNNFIDENILTAQDYGNNLTGLGFFGEATHPIQDNISPAHNDFQYYETPGILGNNLKFALDLYNHIIKESEITNVQLQQAINETRELYKRAYPDDYRRAVPKRFDGAFMYFDGPIDGNNNQRPREIGLGVIAVVEISESTGKQKVKWWKFW